MSEFEENSDFGDENYCESEAGSYNYNDNDDEEFESTAGTIDINFCVIPQDSFIVKDVKEALSQIELFTHQIASFLDVEFDIAEILYQWHDWNKDNLFETFENQKALESCGLDLFDYSVMKSRLSTITPIIQNSNSEELDQDSNMFLCGICFEQYNENWGFSLGCNHWFCLDCYGEYLKTFIACDQSCARFHCPEFKCNQTVPRSVIKSITDDEIYEKYTMSLLNDYIRKTKTMKYCPGPDCNKVIVGSGIKRVQCSCNQVFCFKCGDSYHNPITCDQKVAWDVKCADESETVHWIIVNTKKCPKCSIRIEKNQGCNHMTCRICKHEFCWICMGIWSEHNNSFQCNRFVPVTEGNDKLVKLELDRYLHYFQRYSIHDEAMKFAVKQLIGVDDKVQQYLDSETCSSSWMDVQFLKNAMTQVVECRRMLKYTYIYAFYLPTDCPSRELFEHQQEMLEKNTERLQEVTEAKDIASVVNDGMEVTNLVGITQRFISSLIIEMEEN